MPKNLPFKGLKQTLSSIVENPAVRQAARQPSQTGYKVPVAGDILRNVYRPTNRYAFQEMFGGNSIQQLQNQNYGRFINLFDSPGYRNVGRSVFGSPQDAEAYARYIKSRISPSALGFKVGPGRDAMGADGVFYRVLPEDKKLNNEFINWNMARETDPGDIALYRPFGGINLEDYQKARQAWEHNMKIFKNAEYANGKRNLASTFETAEPGSAKWEDAFEDLANARAQALTGMAYHTPDYVFSPKIQKDYSKFFTERGWKSLGKNLLGTAATVGTAAAAQQAADENTPIVVMPAEQEYPTFASPMYKNGGGIHIKEKNRGKFTASAKAHGKGVQEYARQVVNDPNATTLQKRRAQFAINAKKFNH